MTPPLFWKTTGIKSGLDLVLLHGLGFNYHIWAPIIVRLSPYFRLHLVDLPGHGRSNSYSAVLSLEKIANIVVSSAPSTALWLGWSIGGLVATQIASLYPEAVLGLMTVASSPHFCYEYETEWPGIKHKVLKKLLLQLNDNFFSTIHHFLSLQKNNQESVSFDTKWFRNVIVNHRPSPDVLKNGVRLLYISDLRPVLKRINIPCLRLYGYLDTLVPRTVVPLVDTLWPDSKSIILSGAAHAPFISHPDYFCKIIREFSQNLA